MEILQIKNLTFRYPDAEKSALDSISLSLKAGEFAVICGESGCGKSTLLQLLKRELSPYGEKSGDILYDGVSLSQVDERAAASNIGFVLQNPESQIVTDTVWHELAFGLESLGFDTQVIRRRVAEMASYFGIEEWFHKKTTELSGGQKQLLNLASVMAMQPKILLLDEPTAQLDPIAAMNFIGTLQKLNRELGLTILLVEHRLEDVFPIADRVLVLEEGRLICDDHPKNIGTYFKAYPSHPMLAGLPAAMRIFGLLQEEGDCPITVREGRDYVIENYKDDIDTVTAKPYRHCDEKTVELKEVWFRYERELPDVMKGVSLQVYKGEHFCMLGGNGTGKTTTLGVIAGLLKAYRGKILTKGKVAFLPQNPQTVFLEKTVEEDLGEACRIMKYTPTESEDKIANVVGRLGIEHLLQMHPYDLSGGEQQKAALAKILLLQPQILLLDEPTKGIDAYSKRTLSAIMKELKEEGITIITVTHDVEFAASEADRCGMFFDGELVSTDTPTNFFTENSFYTTAANRISRGYFQNAILCEEVAELCRMNGRKAGRANE
ncbi:MAG: ATP-binding cassette domain-containing protein [Tyzzerella sp.]|nr:ATP-binding cassette domain-containing protein [Tyzzerella sp.]